MAEAQKPGTPAAPDAAAQAKAKEAEEAKAAAAAAAAAKAADDEKAEAERREKEDGEPAFPIAELIASARTLTGYPKHLLAGALSKVDRKTLTIAEAKAEAKRFAAQPVTSEDKS